MTLLDCIVSFSLIETVLAFIYFEGLVLSLWQT